MWGRTNIEVDAQVLDPSSVSGCDCSVWFFLTLVTVITIVIISIILIIIIITTVSCTALC